MNRKQIINWLFWFFAGNALLFWIIGAPNLTSVTPLTLPVPNAIYSTVIWFFLLFASVGQFTLLAFLSSLIVLPFVLICARPLFIQFIAIFLASFAAVFLIIDAVVFAHYHFHLNGIILQMVFSNDSDKMFDFSVGEFFFIGLVFCMLFLGEFCYANMLWKKILTHNLFYSGKKLSIYLATCLFLSYMMFMLSNAQPISFLTQQSQAIPFYNNVLAAILPISDSLAKVNNAGAGNFNQPEQIIKPLRYPLHTLQNNVPQHPKNILIIIIDAWRFDMLNPIVMPHTTLFAQNATQYTDHWSGGNATGPGIFSLFYGLPDTYWSSMKQQQRGPILIETLKQQHYQFGIFASAGLRNPDLQDTVFSQIKSDISHVPGNNVIARDTASTQLFQQFIMKVHQPFFGFVFYDAAHSYCDPDIPNSPFRPMQSVCNRLTLSETTNPVPYLNRYQNALYFLDGQINQVISTLQQQKLLDNTVIIITGDHGEEFNDNHLGYWGHAGNFTRYQVQTPLIIKWPNQPAHVVQQLTSHYDIAPTLLHQELGNQNPLSDYSIGQLLSSNSKRPYLIASSYIDFGVMTKDQLITIYPAGNFTITDLEGKIISGAKLDLHLMNSIFEDDERYYDTK